MLQFKHPRQEPKSIRTHVWIINWSNMQTLQYIWFKVRDNAGAVYLVLFLIIAIVTPFVLVGQAAGVKLAGWSVSMPLILVAMILYVIGILTIAWDEDKDIKEMGLLKVAFSSVVVIVSLILAIIC